MKQQPIYLYKFLRTGLISEHGNCKWKKGVWKKHKGELMLCGEGFHASTNIIDALGYVQGEILAKVEVKGESIVSSDKQVWSEMRIVEYCDWDKKDSVSLAVFSAELVLSIYEKVYPNDTRPREAIEAAIAWLKDPISKNMQVAARAAAEAAARAAEAAAEAAARAAEAAARAAAEAAEAASWAAAAREARMASWAAARMAVEVSPEELLTTIEGWLIQRFKQKLQNSK